MADEAVVRIILVGSAETPVEPKRETTPSNRPASEDIPYVRKAYKPPESAQPPPSVSSKSNYTHQDDIPYAEIHPLDPSTLVDQARNKAEQNEAAALIDAIVKDLPQFRDNTPPDVIVEHARNRLITDRTRSGQEAGKDRPGLDVIAGESHTDPIIIAIREVKQSIDVVRDILIGWRNSVSTNDSGKAVSNQNPILPERIPDLAPLEEESTKKTETSSDWWKDHTPLPKSKPVSNWWEDHKPPSKPKPVSNTETNNEWWKDHTPTLWKKPTPTPQHVAMSTGGAVEQSKDRNHPGGPRGTDTVPAWLTPGEFVVNKKAASENRTQLERMNRGGDRPPAEPKTMSQGGPVEYLAGGGVSGGMGLGRVMVDPASDPSATLYRLGDVAESVGQSLPYVGSAAVVAGEALKGLGDLVWSIAANAERYGQYNPMIAQSLAIAEIRQTLGDMSRSREIDAEMAKYIEVQTDLQQKFEDMKVKALIKILPVLTRILELMEQTLPGAETIGEAVASLLQPISQLAEAAGQMVDLKKDERIPDVEDPTTQLLKVAGPGGFFMNAQGMPGEWTPNR